MPRHPAHASGVHRGLRALSPLPLVLAGACAPSPPEKGAPAVPAAVSAPPAGAAQIDVTPHSVTLHSAGRTLSLSAVSDDIVRVREAAGGALPPDFSWAIVPGANAPKAALDVRDEAASVLASTAHVSVRIAKDSLAVTFLDSSGAPISEAGAQPAALGPDGFRVERRMPADEHYYGLGDKGGPLDRRSGAFANWNSDVFGWQESTDPRYKSIPFFLALRGGKAYGVFLDNPLRTWFDFGKSARDQYAFGSDGGALDYYFIAGPQPKAVVERYADLTGKTPLPPLWSLGFQQSRYSYYPEARVREIAGTLRKKRIPADVLYLDIDYQDRNRPFTVDPGRFPHLEKMVTDLGAEGFKVIAITDPHLASLPGERYRPYDEGAAGDYLVHNHDGSLYVGQVWPGASVFPDFTWAPARAWWGTLYKDFVRAGIAGFWNDMNEPSIFETPSGTMPLDVVHRVDSGGTATHREVHNVYGMQNSRATYEGLRALAPGQRPFVLTRATYAGGQRFAASWTGDNSSTWNHYRLSVPNLLSLGLSGYAMIGDDIGGFVGNPPAELLTRWIELGAFNPIFRDHSNKGSRNQEPWVHGPEHEAIRRRFIEARYRLLPYIYTLAEEASRTGVPLMRPVWLELPELAAGGRLEDEVFFFGPALLVEPVLAETVETPKAFVPPGIWYDYWTGARVAPSAAGGPRQTAAKALGELVVLVRGGAIVSHQPLVQSTAETPKGALELRVYPGPDCRGSVYMDDGATFAYEKGEFLRLAATCDAGADGVTVRLGAAEGKYEPWFRTVAFVVYGAAGAPKQVTIDGVATRDFTYAADRKAVTVVTKYGRAGVVVKIGY